MTNTATKTQVGRVITPLARLSYPQLFTPKAMNDQSEPKYSAELIFEPGTDISALKKVAMDAAKAKWADKIPKNLISPFRDGDKDREGKDGYEGSTFFNAKSSTQPGIVIGPQREECLNQSDVYGGCYVRASVTFYATDKGGQNRVAVALNNVWKIRDGEPFGSRRDAESDFADCEVDAEAFGADENDNPLL